MSGGDRGFWLSGLWGAEHLAIGGSVALQPILFEGQPRLPEHE
jgi:hypothetical protein